ncbi:MAG: DUF2461 domain-containing protein [Eubacterium sp.]|nr:DUF2461 domain-containing protein [Eubacterium sp.]
MNFSQQTLDFLFENRLHDSKAWFTEHKDDYKKYVIQPFSELLLALQPTMTKIDSSTVVDPKKISRIYKDARYSHDSVFRDDVWYNFSRCVGSDVAPTYYIVIGRGQLEYGCGFYAAGSAIMETMRNMIINDDPVAKKALSAYKKQDTFTLCGDMFKRNRFADYSAEKQDWLNRKSIFLSYTTNDGSIIFDPQLWQRIAEDFIKVKPIYQLFVKAQNTARDN